MGTQLIGRPDAADYRALMAAVIALNDICDNATLVSLRPMSRNAQRSGEGKVAAVVESELQVIDDGST